MIVLLQISDELENEIGEMLYEETAFFDYEHYEIQGLEHSPFECKLVLAYFADKLYKLMFDFFASTTGVIYPFTISRVLTLPMYDNHILIEIIPEVN